MLSLFGVTVYFIKILSGSRNYKNPIILFIFYYILRAGVDVIMSLVVL